MPTDYRAIRANRVVVEVDDALLAALDAEVEARGAGIRKSSRAEVIRTLIAEHLLPRHAATEPVAAL